MVKFTILKFKNHFEAKASFPSTDGVVYSVLLPLGPSMDQVESGAVKSPLLFADTIELPYKRLEHISAWLKTCGEVENYEMEV
jgi:hypothetical protein